MVFDHVQRNGREWRRRRTMRTMRSAFALAGMALGAALVLATPARAASESFYTQVPSDVVSLTQSGILSPKHFVPPTIQKFSEPAIKNGIAFLHKLRDAKGEVIGFGTQLEEVALDKDGKFTGLHNTSWTLVIPGRGSLFLFETEDSRKLGSLLRQAPKTTVAMPWKGPVETTTSGPAEGGLGVIMGGTGEFAGKKGTFVEINRFTAIDPNNPSGSPFLFEIEVKVDYAE